MSEAEAWLNGVSYICWTVVWVSLLIFIYNLADRFAMMVDKPISDEECETYIKAKKKVQEESNNETT